jgi:protein gp37
MFFAKYKDNVFTPPYVLNEPQYRKTKNDWYQQAAYPFGFEPTLHRYKLNEPQTWKEPRTIFVGSICDLFGEWVPDAWIEEVFAACAAAPQHRYLFLTKNPAGYAKLQGRSHFLNHDNVWCGYTQTGNDVLSNGEVYDYSCAHDFVSIEPLRQPGWRTLEYIGWNDPRYDRPNWVIIGAETGNRAEKVIPKKAWVEQIVLAVREANVPVFMKDSLLPIVGEENMRRELPWEVKQ